MSKRILQNWSLKRLKRCACHLKETMQALEDRIEVFEELEVEVHQDYLDMLYDCEQQMQALEDEIAKRGVTI